MSLADSVWLATALLHRENSQAPDFSGHEIIEKATQEKLVEGFRPGLQVFISKHCVANKSPNPLRHRILLETTRGRRRLFRKGDPFHPDREGGKIRPDRAQLPLEYQPLVDWYDEVYSKLPPHAAPGPPPGMGVSQPLLPDSTVASGGFDEMRSATTFVGPGGTVVLPDWLQHEMGLKEGSCLSVFRDKEKVALLPVTDDLIHKLRGSLKGNYSLLADRERDHRIEKQR
jgi:hypothetical protein